MNAGPRDPRKDSTALRHLAALKEEIEPHRSALVHHPVYGMVEDPEALRVFMTSHAFAVWDFMTLLKALQLELTGMKLPWRPPADVEVARFINEIVLGEETDEVYPGVYWSHFDLYRAAMDERGADREPIDSFLAAIEAGVEPAEALDAVAIPPATRDFVRFTLQAPERPAHEVASIFLFGREDVIPAMFLRLLDFHGSATSRFRTGLLARDLALKLVRGLERKLSPKPVRLPEGPPRDAFRRYLERHVELDGESHGPMGERLLMSLCRRDPRRWEQATVAAVEALKMRRHLWDGVMKAIQEERARRSRR